MHDGNQEILDYVHYVHYVHYGSHKLQSIMVVRSKVLYLLCESCGKIEFPGKRYNASNLFKRTKILCVLLRVKFKLFYPDRSFLPPDLAGSCRKDVGKSPDPSGKHGKYLEHGSSIPARNFPIISGRILPETTGICRNPPKKTRKIPTRNTASNFLVFSVASRPFPAVRRSPGYLLFFMLVKRFFFFCFS